MQTKVFPLGEKVASAFRVCFPSQGHPGSLDLAPAKLFGPRARPRWRSWLKRERWRWKRPGPGRLRPLSPAQPAAARSSPQPAPPAAGPRRLRSRARPRTQSSRSPSTAPFVCNWPGLPTCQDSHFHGERRGDFPDDVRRAVVHEEAQVADGRMESQRDDQGEGTPDPVPGSL